MNSLQGHVGCRHTSAVATSCSSSIAGAKNKPQCCRMPLPRTPGFSVNEPASTHAPVLTTPAPGPAWRRWARPPPPPPAPPASAARAGRQRPAAPPPSAAPPPAARGSGGAAARHVPGGRQRVRGREGTFSVEGGACCIGSLTACATLEVQSSPWPAPSAVSSVAPPDRGSTSSRPTNARAPHPKFIHTPAAALTHPLCCLRRRVASHQVHHVQPPHDGT